MKGPLLSDPDRRTSEACEDRDSSVIDARISEGNP